MKLSELAEQTNSTIGSGSPELEITGGAGLDIAAPGDITFLANPKYTPQIKETKASAIFLNEKETIKRSDLAVLRTKDPYLSAHSIDDDVLASVMSEEPSHCGEVALYCHSIAPVSAFNATTLHANVFFAASGPRALPVPT